MPTQNFDPNPINRVPDPRNRKKYIKNSRSTAKVTVMLEYGPVQYKDFYNHCWERLENTSHFAALPLNKQLALADSTAAGAFSGRSSKRFVFGTRVQFQLQFNIVLHKWAPKPSHLNRYDPKLYLLSWTSKKMFTDL